MHAYLNDLLIALDNEKQHRVHLRIVFIQLRDLDLTIKPSKCIFGTASVTYWDSFISPEGLWLLAEDISKDITAS